jgi:hypothetical protein
MTLTSDLKWNKHASNTMGKTLNLFDALNQKYNPAKRSLLTTPNKIERKRNRLGLIQTFYLAQLS